MTNFMLLQACVNIRLLTETHDEYYLLMWLVYRVGHFSSYDGESTKVHFYVVV